MRFHKPDVALSHKELNDIEGILKSGWVSSGEYCEKLEHEIRRRTKVKYAIPCANATNGLIIAMKSAGIKGRRVYVPAFTWPSSVYAIKASGNEPVYTDIDKDTYLMKSGVSHSVSEAAMPVDVFGNQCDIENYGYDKVVIDAAHGFDMRELGRRGDAEVISFSHTKIVTGMEGGAILTNDDVIATKARELVRLSARMGEINAYIALSSIKKYDKVNKETRQDIIDFYNQHLIWTFKQKYNAGSNPSVYSLRFSSQSIRDFVARRLDGRGIEYKIYYEPLVNNMEGVNFVYERILCLPVYPHLTAQETADIVNVIKNAIADCKENLDGSGKKHSQYVRDYIE